MSERIRATNWSRTPLGPIESWPLSLRAVVNLILETELPTIIYWGKELTGIYNDAYQALLGSKQKPLGEPIFDLWPKDREVIDRIETNVLGGEASCFKDTLVTLDRHGYPEKVHLDIYFSPVRDEDGSTIGILKTLIETTAAVAAERRQGFILELGDRLRESADPQAVMKGAADALQAQLGVTIVGCVRMREDGELARVEGSGDLRGLNPIAGRFRIDTFGSSVERAVRDGVPIAIEDAETDPRTAAPDVRPVYAALDARSLLIAPLLRSGRPEGFFYLFDRKPRHWTEAEIGLVRDVTQRTWSILEWVQTEQALRESEARFSAIFTRAAAGLCQISLDGRFQHVNEELCRILRRSRKELLGMGIPDVTHPEDLPHSLEALQKLVSHKKTISLDKRYIRSDGKIVFANSALTLLEDEHGRPKAVLAVTIDLTERKQAEQALRESEQKMRELSHTLEKRVEERTSKLKEQARRLRNLAAELTSTEQRERKRLAALLHDDLQQLLVAANMKLNILKRRLAEPDRILEVEQVAKWINEAILGAKDLTMELRPPAIYEDSLVAAINWLASEMKKRHNLDTAVDATEEVELLSDNVKVLVFESVRELLFNVVKYADAGAASVVVRQEKGYIRVAVSDKGRGFKISYGDQERPSGGFGLFSIRERLFALGGKMTINSQVGSGTVVVLQVPVFPAEVRQQVSPVVKSHTRTGSPGKRYPHRPADDRMRIVVADDHALVRKGIANIINSDDRLVVIGEAEDGVAAIEIVEQKQPDVVLMDINMPRMNGIEATREIHRRWPQIRIIGLSVQDDETTAQSMLKAGATSFLPKAGEADRMISAILNVASK